MAERRGGNNRRADTISKAMLEQFTDTDKQAERHQKEIKELIECRTILQGHLATKDDQLKQRLDQNARLQTSNKSAQAKLDGGAARLEKSDQRSRELAAENARLKAEGEKLRKEVADEKALVKTRDEQLRKLVAGNRRLNADGGAPSPQLAAENTRLETRPTSLLKPIDLSAVQERRLEYAAKQSDG